MSDYDPNDDGTRYDPWTREAYTVVWGGGALLGPRDTKVIDPGWTPARRIYNRKVEAPRPVEIDQDVSDEIDQQFVTVYGDNDDDS